VITLGAPDPADIPALCALITDAVQQDIAPHWTPPAVTRLLDELGPDALARKIAAATWAGVAHDGERPVGLAVLTSPGVLGILFVAPGHQRRGVGRVLWSAAVDHLRTLRPPPPRVELNAAPAAVGFYARLGFEPVGEPFERDGARATRMAWTAAPGHGPAAKERPSSA